MKKANCLSPDAAQRNPRIAAPDSVACAIASELCAAHVVLSDNESFQTINGLWKGKKSPLTRAIVVRNTNFTNEGILDLRDVAELDVETKQLASRTLQRGDIIIERSGGGPKQAVGRVCYFDATGELPYSFSNFTSVIRVLDPACLLPRYVHYRLLHLYKDGYTEGLQHATTGIRNLDFSSYLKTEIPVLPMPEQQKIAAILWKLQRAIATQDRLLKATRDLKQSAMQRLFTHGLRGEPLKDTEIGLVPESWDIEEVRAIATIKGGKRLPKGVPLSITHTPFPYIRVTDFSENSVDTSAIRFVPPEVQPQIARYIISTNDVYISIAGSIGLVGMVPPQLDGANLTENAARLLAGKRIDPAFLMRFLSSDLGQSQINSFTSKNAQPKLALTRIDDIRAPVPKQLSEQRDIAAALATIDRKLAHHQRKRAALDALFQSTLHQLMTAQIRVADLDIDTSEVIPPTAIQRESA